MSHQIQKAILDHIDLKLKQCTTSGSIEEIYHSEQYDEGDSNYLSITITNSFHHTQWRIIISEDSDEITIIYDGLGSFSVGFPLSDPDLFDKIVGHVKKY